MENQIYDIAGIGIGPFNLGLAALAAPIDRLKCIFFDAKPFFSWHPGLMLGFAKLQVPFYADLVTGADPSNQFSFLNYMKRTGRLFQFAILEDNYITRKEYNDYCFWVASQVPNLHFGHSVTHIEWDEQQALYRLETISEKSKVVIIARQIVIGVGSTPFIPDFIDTEMDDNLFHSSAYLGHKKALLQKKNVTLIGSGQSAAEIFYDLLITENSSIKQLDWITRSERLFPMDVSKFSLEMTSPDYINYFHALPTKQKRDSLKRQDSLYKGINQELLSDIYRLLYHAQSSPTEISIRTNCELKMIEPNFGSYRMKFHHRELQKDFLHGSDAVVLATGYHRPLPNCIEGIREFLQWEEDGNYRVAKNYSVDKNGGNVFVQNADLHSHGFNAPDLGMGTYRNAVILNAILGYDHFMVEKRIAFQDFGI